MGVRRTRIAACVALVVASGFLFVDSTHAQGDCVQAMDQGLNKIRAFDQEAKKQAMDFAVDTTVDVALGDARKILADKTIPSQASALQMELHKAKIEAWEQIQKTFAVTVEDLYACMAPGSKCNMLDFMKNQNQAFQRWMQTFSSESTQGARERVSKARELLQNNVKQLAGNATGSIGAAVACMDLHVKAGAAADAVDTRNPPQKPQTIAKKGGSAAPRLLIAGGAAAAAAVTLAKVLPTLTPSIVDPPITGSGSAGGSGVRGYDGTYDLQLSSATSSGLTTLTLPRFFRVNNGVVTSNDNTVNGTVTSSGATSFVGPCPLNNSPADYSGSLTTGGTGSGTYRCRVEPITREWKVFNRS
jgi:hypothetical protein